MATYLPLEGAPAVQRRFVGYDKLSSEIHDRILSGDRSAQTIGSTLAELREFLADERLRSAVELGKDRRQHANTERIEQLVRQALSDKRAAKTVEEKTIAAEKTAATFEDLKPFLSDERSRVAVELIFADQHYSDTALTLLMWGGARLAPGSVGKWKELYRTFPSSLDAAAVEDFKDDLRATCHGYLTECFYEQSVVDRRHTMNDLRASIPGHFDAVEIAIKALRDSVETLLAAILASQTGVVTTPMSMRPLRIAFPTVGADDYAGAVQIEPGQLSQSTLLKALAEERELYDKSVGEKVASDEPANANAPIGAPQKRADLVLALTLADRWWHYTSTVAAGSQWVKFLNAAWEACGNNIAPNPDKRRDAEVAELSSDKPFNLFHRWQEWGQEEGSTSTRPVKPIRKKA